MAKRLFPESETLSQNRPDEPKKICFRLYISYFGANFHGVQEQANARTVFQELRQALIRIIKSEFTIKVAGRTDAFVHARGQVVSLECTTRLNAEKLTLALASILPKDISAWRIDNMPLGFDARRQSIGKRYVYRIYHGLVRDPFLGMTALHLRKALDIDAMQRASVHFVGEHDFSSFRASGCTAKHAIRYLWHVGIKQIGPILEIDIRGNAFCMNMVRIMVGTLVEVGVKRRSPDSILTILAKRDRRFSGITAKAHGLTLEHVYYPDDIKEAGIPDGAIFPRYPVTSDSLKFFAGE